MTKKPTIPMEPRKLTDKGGGYLCPEECDCGGDITKHDSALSMSNIEAAQRIHDSLSL